MTFFSFAFRGLPEHFSSYLSKKLMTLFLVINFSLGFLPLHIVILYRLLLFPIFVHFIPLIYPYIHTYILFFRFYTLLSTKVTINTAFHHCTFSFITAHFVHHCTLKQALHTLYTHKFIYIHIDIYICISF